VTAYLAIASTRFRMLLQYRAAALGGVFTQTFFGLVRISILEAFVRANPAASPMTLPQLVGYVWLGQAALAMFPWNTDKEIRESIRSGGVAYELCRPLDLYHAWASRILAWRLAPTLLRLVPMFFLAMVVLPAVGLETWALRPPASLLAGGVWLLSMAGALLLSTAVSMLLQISLFWTISGKGIQVLAQSLTTLLGGLIIPLPLFPEWAQSVLRALPFAGLVDLPSRIYTGHITGSAALATLGVQLGWTVALVVLGRHLLGRGVRRVVVQGG
jgi:ABC-2 type transport system permease protein